MRIRDQFLISIAVFSIIFTVFAGSVFVAQQQTFQLSDQETISRDIQTRASNLAYLSSNYFLYQDLSAFALWQTEFSSLSTSVSKLKALNPEQQTLLNNVRDDAQRLNNRWTDVATYLENAPRNVSIRILPEFQIIWGRMTLQNQGLIFDAEQLSQVFRSQIDKLNTTSIILIFALLALFGAYFITNYLVTYRNTLKSISELQTGIAAIGSGNLDYTLKLEKKDEIGAISASVNQMATNLKAVTASKADLEKEISERKKLEAETQRLLGTVQEERDRLSSLLSSINDEVWLADAEKKFTLANPSAIKEFKLDSQNIDVENLAATSEVYRPDGTPRPIDEAPPLRALNGEVLKNQEEIVKTPATGELRYRQVSSAPVRDREGNIIGSISVVRDITELKQLQNRLEKYAADLEKLVAERTKQLKDAERLAAIGATAGMVGHDIRNPLQGITSDVYLAKNELSSTPDSEYKQNAMESLDEIEKNVTYINKIVQDLQDFARPLKPVAEEVDLEEVCEQVLLKTPMPENVKTSCRFNNDAKQIISDPNILIRVISNLVLNAVQAMPEGGRISLRGYQEAGDTIVAVQDTGVGIPDDVKDKLFTPMFTTKSKGQGFGLAVVKRMIESLDGTVTYESQVGKGTTFTVRLPQQTK